MILKTHFAFDGLLSVILEYWRKVINFKKFSKTILQKLLVSILIGFRFEVDRRVENSSVFV